MSGGRKSGQTIRSEGREIIRNIIKQCDQEAREGRLKYPLKRSNLRVANYVGVSVRKVISIRREKDSAGESLPALNTSSKKRPKSEDDKFHCDDFDRRVIRDIISDFYLVQKKVPTAPKLLVAIREKIHFPWEIDTLRNLLLEMGFQWKKFVNNRKLLIERPSIVPWRCRYLRNIKTLRSQSRNIVYVDESWVDNNLIFGKCWQGGKTPGIRTKTSSSNRLIFVHAASRNGFIDGTQLVFRAGIVTGDYHGQMNGGNFDKWVNEKLLPNLQKGSVVIVDNAPYHNIQENKPPTQYAAKRDMLEWLQRNSVPCSHDMRKFELFELIQKLKSPEKVYRFDEVLCQHGHTVLRLPPYVCELNAIELAWANVKRLVREHIITEDLSLADLSLAKLQEVINNALASLTPADWDSFYQHVITVENDLWVKDGLMEDELDKFIINGGGTSSSDDEDDYSTSTSDSELLEYCSDPECAGQEAPNSKLQATEGPTEPLFVNVKQEPGDYLEEDMVLGNENALERNADGREMQDVKVIKEEPFG